MKFQGVEGMSVENVREEVNRGGRLVIYTYCVSILVMTFKRPAGIRLIRAGHSPAAAGWPYILVSVLFGWWGIPWGPIYTIETIYRNLAGGIDVTDELMAQMTPAAPRLVTPPGVSAKPPAVAAPPQFAAAPAPARGFNLKAAGLMAGVVAALVLVGITLYCYHQARNLTVVLASGSDQTYTVVINDQSYTMKPHSSTVLEFPEGDFVLKDAPGAHVVGGTHVVNFALPFFSHLDTDRVAILNPDRAAILLNTKISYYSNGTTPPADAEPDFTILANQESYFIPKPDFVIEAAPEHISMPSGSSHVIRTRLENFHDADLPSIVEALSKRSGYAAARDHLMILAPRHSDEAFLTTVVQTLQAPDLEPFFKLRLAERPLLVEWHRYYQRSMEVTQPNHDLVAEYRASLKAEPANNALRYLLGRQTPDAAEAKQLWEQALTGTQPCYHALGALGFDAMCEGRFADALAHYTASEKAGIGGSARKQYRRQLYWALQQPEPLFADLALERKADPLSVVLADEEIRATLAFKPAGAAQKLKDSYLAALQATKPAAKDFADTEAYLQAGIAYQTGDLPAYAKLISRFDSPFYKFRAAFTRGEFTAAVDALRAQDKPQPHDWLLLYLLAQSKGEAAMAETQFKVALAAMKDGTHEYQRLAEQLAAANPDVPAICAAHLEAEEKRVLLTALGVRHPAFQSAFFEAARKMNFNPEFPYQFLRPILAQSLKPG